MRLLRAWAPVAFLAVLVAALSPSRARAEGRADLAYARLGAATLPAAGTPYGPAVGLGYRHAFGSFGVDASAFNYVFPTNLKTATDTDDPPRHGSWARLMGLWLSADEAADRRWFVGGGGSYGSGAYRTSAALYSGSGPQADLVAGYTGGRGALRTLVQLDVTLPLYRVGATFASGERFAYAPTVALSFGLGFGWSFAGGALDEAGWRVVSSRHFRVYTRGEIAAATRFIERLEEAYAGMQSWLFTGTDVGVVEAVLFDEQEFHDRLGPVGGVYVPRAGKRGMLATFDGGDRQFFEGITAHELAHRFIAARFPRAPVWFNEGLASYLETIRIEGSRVWYGGLASHYLDEVGSGRVVPIGELVTAKRTTFHGAWESSHYATAWALIHYLLHGERGALRDRFEALASSLHSGGDARAVLAAVYPEVPLAAMEARLRDHAADLIKLEMAQRVIGAPLQPPARDETRIETADDAYVRAVLTELGRHRRADRL